MKKKIGSNDSCDIPFTKIKLLNKTSQDHDNEKHSEKYKTQER